LTFLIGIIKGLAKQIIGLLAVIIGLILAVHYYNSAADLLIKVINNRMISNLLAFLGIFFVVVSVGAVISWSLSKIIKGPLKFVNHILGAALGILKGILICGVIVFALLIFPVNKKMLKESELAAYCAQMTKAVYYLIPRDLREEFYDAYDDIIRNRGEDEERI